MATSSGYSSSISTFPIRAPLTVDSDSESSLSSKGQKYENSNIISNSSSYGSDISGFESEGFLSSEDEFGAGSERPFVADPDDDLSENDDFVNKNSVFWPFVNNPKGEGNEYGISRACVAGRTGVDAFETASERPFVADLGADPAESDDFVSKDLVFRHVVNDRNGKGNEYGVSRPYVASTNREGTRVKSKEDGECRDIDLDPVDNLNENNDFVENTIVIRPIVNDPCGKINENGVSSACVDFGESSFVDIGNPAIQKPIIPIAKLSRDSDEESLAFDDVENDEFSCFDRISNSHDLEKIESDIRIKVSINDEFEPKFDEVFERTKMSSENTELQGDEIVASDVVIDYGHKNDSINGSGSEGSSLVEIGSADSVKKMENQPKRSYDVYDPLLMSTLGIEFTESKDKEGFDKGDSEKLFSINDYSYGSIIDDIDQTSSPSALDGSSNDDVDILKESKEKEFLDPNTSKISPIKNSNEEKRMNSEEIQPIRAELSKLVQRLGLSLEDPITANQLFIFQSAMNTDLEFKYENGKADYDLSLNILVIGKTGVGKSATINSLFDEKRASVSAFEPATTCVTEIIGTINGIKVRIFDTPGFRSLPKEQSFNSRVFSSIKRSMRKSPPDIVLYVDRLDIEREDLNDLEFLRSITKFFGTSIWEKAIILLTHAGSSPTDGPNGSLLSYDVYVARRLSTIQLMISRSLGHIMLDLSSNGSFSLVENGEKSFFDREKWRLKLLLLCSSMKILSEASLGVKNQGFLGHLKINQRLENLSVVTWRGGIGWSGNLQFEFSLGKGSRMVFRAGLNDSLSERVSFRIGGFKQLQLMFWGIFSIANAVVR